MVELFFPTMTTIAAAVTYTIRYDRRD